MRRITRISSIAQECAVVVLTRTLLLLTAYAHEWELDACISAILAAQIRMSEFIFLSRRIDLKPPFPTTFLFLFVAVERGRRHSAANVLTCMRANGAVYGYTPQAG
jgi:hypothetical protein